MLPFFNQANRWRLSGQIVNAAALLISAYDLIQNPHDALKTAPSIASHLLNIYTLNGSDSLILDGITGCLALDRCYVIYNSSTFDNVASVVRVLDIASHVLSVGILFLADGQNNHEARADLMQPSSNFK